MAMFRIMSTQWSEGVGKNRTVAGVVGARLSCSDKRATCCWVKRPLFVVSFLLFFVETRLCVHKFKILGEFVLWC